MSDVRASKGKLRSKVSAALAGEGRAADVSSCISHEGCVQHAARISCDSPRIYIFHSFVPPFSRSLVVRGDVLDDDDYIILHYIYCK